MTAAEQAYKEVIASAWRVYKGAMDRARQAHDEIMAPAKRAYNEVVAAAERAQRAVDLARQATVAVDQAIVGLERPERKCDELLVALEGVVMFCNRDGSFEDGFRFREEVLKARALIARVEGERNA